MADGLTSTTEKVAPIYFSDCEFVENNIQLIREYAELRANGFHSETAFCRVFGGQYNDNHLGNRIAALESNRAYLPVFEKALGAINYDKMWNPKMAAQEILAIARNPYIKSSTRLAAIKELNVLFGIIITDPAGNSRAAGHFSEFYKDEVQTKRHPEPGTAEAQARRAQERPGEVSEPLGNIPAHAVPGTGTGGR